MPAPKRASVDDFFAQLPEVQLPHLTKLRELSLIGGAKAGVIEELKWNFPAYSLLAEKKPVMAWTLQTFKNHCSIRFPVPFFGAYRKEAEDAGYEAIEGALKIRWDQKMPEVLIKKLIRERIKDFKAGNTAWSLPGQYEGKKK